MTADEDLDMQEIFSKVESFLSIRQTAGNMVTHGDKMVAKVIRCCLDTQHE